jgi:hypothetical protein
VNVSAPSCAFQRGGAISKPEPAYSRPAVAPPSLHSPHFASLRCGLFRCPPIRGPIRSVLLAFALALLFTSCEAAPETGSQQETPPVLPPPGGATGATAAVSADGAKVRVSFTADDAGTYYALLLPAGEPDPSDTQAVKDHAAKTTGTASAGQNSFTITGLSPAAYNVYIALENGEGILLADLLPVRDINAAPFTITGSQWYMGAGRLTFGGDGKITFHEEKYSYTYNEAAKTGYVSGHRNKNTTVYDGKKSGDIINALGNFTVNIDDGFVGGITFSNYRETNFTMEFTPTRQTQAANSLAGTTWWWRATSLFLEFLPNGKVLMFSNSGYYPHPHIYSSYTFDSETEIGKIEKADRVCSYSTALTALGGFVIKHDWKDDRKVILDNDLYFPGPEGGKYYVMFEKSGYKNYGHRADFHKLSND